MIPFPDVPGICAGEYPDTVLIYPRIAGTGVRGATQPTNGEPIECRANVQPDGLPDKPLRDVLAEGQRSGKLGGVMLLKDEPPVEIVAGSRIEHTASERGPLAKPDVYTSQGRAIPPAGFRRRWTIVIERNN